MANMTFKTNILPNSDFEYSLGSSANPLARWNVYGNLTGNADTATKAEQDADGFVFHSTYVKLVAGTNIPATSAAHADLNALDLLKTGSYAVSATANVPYVDHMPSDYSTTLTDHPAFMMNVYAPLSSVGTTTSGNWIYRILEIIPYNNHIYRWRRMNSTNGSGTWSFGTWTRQILTDTNTNTDTLVKLTASTTNGNYKLLATASTSPTSGNAAEAIYDTNITINPKTHTITATNFAGNATTATTATKLGTANEGSSMLPIYLSAGAPTACTTPSSGAWWTAIPLILSDGVMEIGKYIDFHTTSNGTTDYDVRITAETTGLTITGTTSGTFSGKLTTSKIIGSGTAIYGTDLPSSGTVGQIFFKYVT